MVDGAGDRRAPGRSRQRRLGGDRSPTRCVGSVLVAASPDAEHAVDVTDRLDAGVASLEAHVAYLRGLGDGAMSDAREFLENGARPVGERLGVTFGVAFEVVRF